MFPGFFFTRRALVRFGAVAVAMLLFLIVWLTLSQILHPPAMLPPADANDIVGRYYYYYSGASKGKIALTFDDGPIPTDTLAVADVLADRSVPATFFFLGRNVLAHPEIVREISDRGFLIGNHSYSHEPTVHKSYAHLKRELDSTAYLITTITGTVPHYYRPPFLLGIGTDPTLNPELSIPKDVGWILQAGYTPVGVDIDTYDWAVADPNDVLAALGGAKRGNHILLLHDHKLNAEHLGLMIDTLRAEGYRFVTVDELLTPPSSVRFSHLFGLGATDLETGGEVSKLQWFLYDQGFGSPYDMHGVFTEETASAVLAFQVSRGIVDPAAPDAPGAGRVDAATARVIAATPLAVRVAPATREYSLVPALERAALYAFGSAGELVTVLIIFSVLLVFFRFGTIVPLALLGGVSERGRSKRAGFLGSVTVLIPAWNEAENIDATVQSVARSKYPHLEIIVVDDGSTDGTARIAEETRQKYTDVSIRVLSQENQGKAAALNHGLREASGEVVIVMDGDATFTPSTVGLLAAHFDDPSVGAVSGKVYPVGAPSLLYYLQYLEYLTGQNVDKRALAVLNAVPVVPGPVGAWRKSDVLRVGGFTNETLVEDQDMTLALLSIRKRIVYEPRAIAYTEAPSSVGQFIRQRYRWVFGSYRCFGKYLAILSGARNLHGTYPYARFNTVLALFNILMYGILLPLTYPIVDLFLIYALIANSWEVVILPIALFTLVDTLYALVALSYEKNSLRAVAVIPIARLVYRQLLLYVVLKALIAWVEGSVIGWMKVKKTGEAQRHFATTAN